MKKKQISSLAYFQKLQISATNKILGGIGQNTISDACTYSNDFNTPGSSLGCNQDGHKDDHSANDPGVADPVWD